MAVAHDCQEVVQAFVDIGLCVLIIRDGDAGGLDAGLHRNSTGIITGQEDGRQAVILKRNAFARPERLVQKDVRPGLPIGRVGGAAAPNFQLGFDGGSLPPAHIMDIPRGLAADCKQPAVFLHCFGKGHKIQRHAILVIKNEDPVIAAYVFFGNGKRGAGGDVERVFFINRACPAKQVFPAADQGDVVFPKLPAFFVCDKRSNVLYPTLRGIRRNAVAANGIVDERRLFDMVRQGDKIGRPGFLDEVFPQPFGRDMVCICFQYTFCHDDYSFNWYIEVI